MEIQHMECLEPMKYSVLHTHVKPTYTHSGYSSGINADECYRQEEEHNKCKEIFNFFILNYILNYECH